jgi:hypothetical protein
MALGLASVQFSIIFIGLLVFSLLRTAECVKREGNNINSGRTDNEQSVASNACL